MFSGQHTGSIQAGTVEQLLEKQRISQSRCGWAINCYQMCFDHSMENQESLLNTQRLTHDSSAVEEIDEDDDYQR